MNTINIQLSNSIALSEDWHRQFSEGTPSTEKLPWWHAHHALNKAKSKYFTMYAAGNPTQNRDGTAGQPVSAAYAEHMREQQALLTGHGGSLAKCRPYNPRAILAGIVKSKDFFQQLDNEEVLQQYLAHAGYQRDPNGPFAFAAFNPEAVVAAAGVDQVTKIPNDWGSAAGKHKQHTHPCRRPEPLLAGATVEGYIDPKGNPALLLVREGADMKALDNVPGIGVYDLGIDHMVQCVITAPDSPPPGGIFICGEKPAAAAGRRFHSPAEIDAALDQGTLHQEQIKSLVLSDAYLQDVVAAKRPEAAWASRQLLLVVSARLCPLWEIQGAVLEPGFPVKRLTDVRYLKNVLAGRLCADGSAVSDEMAKHARAQAKLRHGFRQIWEGHS